MSTFFDEGAELHAKRPELMLAEVWRRLDAGMSNADAIDFVEGFKAARRRRDEFIAERGTP